MSVCVERVSILMTKKVPRRRRECDEAEHAELHKKTYEIVARPWNCQDSNAWKYQTIKSIFFSCFSLFSRSRSTQLVGDGYLSRIEWEYLCDGNFSFLFIIWKIQSENDKSRYEVKIHVSVESFASFRLELAGVENSVQFSLYFGCRTFPLIFHLGSSAAVSRQRKEKLKWKLGKFVQFLWIFHLRDYEWASKKKVENFLLHKWKIEILFIFIIVSHENNSLSHKFSREQGKPPRRESAAKQSTAVTRYTQ